MVVSCIGVSAKEIYNHKYEIEYFDIVSKNTITGEISTRTLNTALTTNAKNNNIQSLTTESCQVLDTDMSKNITRNNIQPYQIIGSDTRQKITSPSSSIPYKRICRIVTYWDRDNDGNIDSTVSVGTGFLIGPSVVLTVGHVVYKEEYGWCEYARITCAQNGTNETPPFGKQESTTIHVGSAWIEQQDVSQDWAIIEIDSAVGNQIGWFSTTWSNSNLTGTSVTTTGYPNDKTGQDKATMWKATGSITDSTSSTIKHDCDTSDGMSGSPVYKSNNTVVAIHRGSVGSVNRAVRISEWLYNTINEFN